MVFWRVDESKPMKYILIGFLTIAIIIGVPVSTVYGIAFVISYLFNITFNTAMLITISSVMGSAFLVFCYIIGRDIDCEVLKRKN